MINKFIHIAKGFTLVETLIAVLILSMSIVGPMSIAARGLNQTLVAKDEFVAFYLAQDALEQVRYLRDSACLAAGPGPNGDCDASVWLSQLTGLAPPGGGDCTSANGCEMDTLGNTVTTCNTTCDILKFDPSSGSYGYTNGTVTPQQFLRTVKIIPGPGGFADQAFVTVTVSWTDIAGVTHPPVTLQETLLRWQ